MGIGPVEAVPKVLRQVGLSLDDIGLVELNEAFAAQALAVIRELGMDPETVNVNGGAIALGHPLGCTGAKVTATLLSEMRRRKVRYGLVTMCIGGGMSAAGVFENLVLYPARPADPRGYGVVSGAEAATCFRPFSFRPSHHPPTPVADIPVKPRRSGMPWWIWVVVALAVALVAWLVLGALTRDAADDLEDERA